MGDTIEKVVMERMLSDIDGTAFYVHKSRNGQDTSRLISDAKSLIAEHGLSASEAKGFLEYMKMVIDSVSYIPQKTEPKS